MAQLGARLDGIEEVEGSNPFGSTISTMPSYVAFLRGINVGGSKLITMLALRAELERAGLENVRTLLASGNVLFDSRSENAAALERQIETAIKKKFGMQVSVILRERGELEKLVRAEPFKGVKVMPQTRLFVTFLGERHQSKLKAPYVSPEKNFRILRLTEREICSVLTIGERLAGNMKWMSLLDREFGKRITTRTWGTVQKCLR